MAKAWLSAVKAVTDARIRQAAIFNKVPNTKFRDVREPAVKPVKFEHQQPGENQLFNTTQILNMIEQCVDDYCTEPGDTSNNIIRLHSAEPDSAVSKDSTTTGAPTCVVQPLGILETGSRQERSVDVVPTGRSFQSASGSTNATPESLNWFKSSEITGGKFAAWKAQKLEAEGLVGIGSRPSESAPDSARSESTNWFKSHEASGKLAAWKAQKDEAEAMLAAQMQQEQDEMTTPLASAVGHGVTKRKLEFEEEELDDSPASNWKRNCLDRGQSEGTPMQSSKDHESDAADSECNSEAELGTPEWMDSGDEGYRGVGSDAEDNDGDQQVPSRPQTPYPKVKAEANEEDTDEDETKKKKYQCKYCDETFERKKKFKKHMKRKHDSRKNQESSLPETSSSKKEEKRSSRYVQRSIPCTCCSKRFYKESALIEHLNRKKGIKSFVCETCESSFSRKENLQRHQRNGHSSDKKAKFCKVCKLSFTNREDYADHKNKEHGNPGEDSFKCKSCEKVFQNWSSLVSHTRTHTKETFDCPLCDESFCRDWDYRKHRKAVHGGQGEYKCDRCESNFKRRGHLASHLKKSHGDSDTRDCRDGRD